MAVNTQGPGGHDAGDSFIRAITAVICAGSAMLTVALAIAMSRWLIG